MGSLEYGFCDIETKHVFESHPECQGGSFYLAEWVFTSSAGKTYLQVSDMNKKGYQSSTASHHKLHESFFDGLYYFATDNFFYVVKEHTEFGLVYHRTKDLRSKEEKDVITVSLSVAKFLSRHQTRELPCYF